MNEVVYWIIVYDEMDYVVVKIPVPYLEWARELARKIDECKHYSTSITL